MAAQNIYKHHRMKKAEAVMYPNGDGFMEKNRLLVAGGDVRMLYAAEKLSDIYDVEIIGFDKDKLSSYGNEISESFKRFGSTGAKADVLLLPPVFNKKEFADVCAAMERIKDGGTVLLGVGGEQIEKEAESKGLRHYNYMKDEVLALANAVPTAEVALKTAMEETGRTIWGSRVLVTGFGRIGEILTDRLVKLGADVTAAARKEYDRMKIKAMGVKPSGIMPDRNLLSETDIIFNTVPAEIFGAEEIMSLGESCIFIDLASKPGGIKKEAFSYMKCKYVWATGLPAYEMYFHKKIMDKNHEKIGEMTISCENATKREKILQQKFKKKCAIWLDFLFRIC